MKESPGQREEPRERVGIRGRPQSRGTLKIREKEKEKEKAKKKSKAKRKRKTKKGGREFQNTPSKTLGGGGVRSTEERRRMNSKDNFVS